MIARRGGTVPLDSVGGLVAIVDGEPAGIATFLIDGSEVEVITLDCFTCGVGVGTAVFEGVAQLGRQAGCLRLWLVTTNENVDALRFYTRRGLRLVAVHRGAVASARLRKPAIPLRDEHGVAIEDELEFERFI